MNKIQSMVLPKYDLCTELSLYFRVNDRAVVDYDGECVFLDAHGRIWSDTYFNGLSVGKWKKHTNIKTLSFRIRFKGELFIKWGLHRLDYIYKDIYQSSLSSEDCISEKVIELPFWEDLEEGMLIFEICSLKDGSAMFDYSYETADTPLRTINLGIVITHFNRQQYVLPALERMRKGLLSDAELKNMVTVAVVDNSQNLPAVDGINIVKNNNIGGSGGFTRGLDYIKENTQCNYCLFMDDDASCEMDSIKRTIAFLAYCTDENAAIAGAMLREIEPFRQIENGAQFNGYVKPLKPGYDLRSVLDLLANEVEEKVDYGAWWYFCFPLTSVKHYAFPYFVRGDDISFGISHDFNILTLNGVASWQDDFSLKHSPMNAYLDTRHQIAHILQGHVRQDRKFLLKMLARTFMHYLLTYQYEMALAVIIAMQDVMKGKEFWKNNLDLSERRNALSALFTKEKTADIDKTLLYSALSGNPHERRWRRIFRWLTLNGYLLPKCFFKDKDILVWQHKGGRISLREIFLYQKVLFVHWPTKKGYVVSFDRKAFFSLLFKFISEAVKLFKAYPGLREEYSRSYQELTSPEFWKSQF